jgi:hypothetical protein
MKIASFILTLAVACVTLFSSCHDADNLPLYGTFKLHLHSNIDTNEIDLGSVYRDADGRQIQLNTAQFYISNIKLVKADGSLYPIDNAYVLKQVAQEQYVVGQALIGEYKAVIFDVGVGAAANHQNPSSFPSTNPLSQSGPDTWFGTTTQGYVFMNVAGKVDTSANNNGAVDFPVSYKIGSDALLKTVTLPAHPNGNFVMGFSQEMYIHLICDYGALLKGINFKTQASTTTTTNPDVATQVANNIPKMFTYEE